MAADYSSCKKFFSKAKKLCRASISTSKYPTLTNSLKDFTNSIEEDIGIINRMDVSVFSKTEKKNLFAK